MPTIFTYKTAADQPSFTVETAIRGYEPSRPYPQNPQIIIYRTRFTQLRAYYSRPSSPLPHPYLPQVYFADDVEFQDRPGGLVEWTRIYTTLPTSWNDYSSDIYNYPGYQGTLAILGRNPYSHIVTTKEVRDYYLVGNVPNFSSMLTNSDNLASNSYSFGNLTASANAGTIPTCAGATNVAAYIVSNTANDIHFFKQTAATNVGYVTASCFFKANTASKVDLSCFNDAQLYFANVTVDLNTGQPISDQTIIGNGFGIASIGDGWWRVNVTGYSTSANSSIIGRLVNDSNQITFAGNGAGLFAWRAQLVQSNTAPYATVPPTVAGDGTTNYPLSQPDQIPVKFGTRYLYQTPWGYGTSTTSGNFIAEYLSDGGYGLVATDPTLVNYKAFVTADAANTNSYSIEAQDSSLSLWYGNIWERQRKFVKAI